MSYILDALRKADAERERGAVPGLHAQPASAAAAAAAAAPGAPALRWLIAAGVALALVVLGWLALRPAETAAPAAAVSAAVPLAPVAAAPTAPATPPNAAPAAPTAMLTLPAAEPPARPKPSVFASAPPRTVAAAAVVAAPPAEPAPAASADTRIRDLKELPEDIRRQLPPLTIGGAMYSDNAASRMLIINGQLFHENDKIGPDHVLEQIRLKSAVLRFKGTRYGIAY